MFGHELVARDIHQQILLLENLHLNWQQGGDDLQRGGGRRGLRDEDAGVVVLLLQQLREHLQIFDPHTRTWIKLHMDGAYGRLAGGLDRAFGAATGCWQGGVAFEHSGGRARGENHLCALGGAFGVADLVAEFGEGDGAFVFGELVAAVEAHGFDGAGDAPEAGQLLGGFVIAGHGGGGGGGRVGGVEGVVGCE